MVQQISKNSGSESEIEALSFDKAINEVFRLLPQELCPKPSEEHISAKPLSGIEQLMESHATPLLVLSQSELVEPASTAQLDAPSDWRPGGHGFNPRRGRQHSFMEIDHEIFSMVILSLPLIQEGQLSVSGERMCIILVNRLED